MTQEEFLTLAEELRPYTEQAMKIEPVAWIKDYLVDMEELYTELTLEKINNKPFGQKRKKLENYKELFSAKNVRPASIEAEPSKFPRRIHRKKILFKGEPGRGKTTLSKKIAYDWAKGLFTSVSIIFFVYLKLVKPGDAIESVIISQTPALQGMGIKKEKIVAILETFGDQCLIVFDGLDEHAFGLNEDVLKILTGAKWLHTNVVVTSRPHTATKIEKNCETIVSVEGFTRSEAKKFASLLVHDQEKVQQILDFNPNGRRLNERQYLHNVPILLSFLCVLVREDGIDLSDRSISVGEVYFRMVRCLYKKFTIRKGIEFWTSSFLQVLKSLGKLALRMLLTGNPVLKRSEVIAEVGPDAFDYGLLIGHEDFRLIRDETADILVTFPHRSLQEFLGAFYFVLTLNEKTDSQNISSSIIEFLINPLFHEFCLWWLDYSQLTKICPSWNAQQAQELLASYAAGQINHVKIDLIDIVKRFPAFEAAVKDENQKASTMLGKVLSKCDKLRHLGIGFQQPTGQFLSSLGPLFKLLRSIEIPEIFGNLEKKSHTYKMYGHQIRSAVERLKHHRKSTDNDLIIIVTSHSDENLMSALVDIYKECLRWDKSPSVFIDKECLRWDKSPSVFIDKSAPLPYLRDHTRGQFELAEVLNESVKELHLFHCKKRVCLKEIPLCPKLTHLYLDRVLCLRTVRGFMDKFPQLTHLSLSYCRIGEDESLSSLFQSQCSSVTNLHLSGFELEWRDLHFLHSVNTDTDNSLLPNLSSLVLDSRTVALKSSLSILFQNPWKKLTQIRYEGSDHDVGHYHLKEFISIINDSKLPNLVTLHLERVKGDLNSLDERKVRKLNSLTLNSFMTGPHEELLESLIKKLSTWELKKLDISDNRIVVGTLYLLESTALPSLKSLIVTDCGLNKRNLRSLGVANENGRLPELTYLDISWNKVSFNVGFNLSLLFSAKFPSLQELIVRDNGLDDDDLRALARANAKGKLPELKHLDISGNYLEESLKLLTVDPDTDRKVSWKSVKCDDEYLGDDYDHVSDDDEYFDC